MAMDLESQLEAVLFWKGEPWKKAKVAAALSCTAEQLETALAGLETKLSGRGLRLVRSGNGDDAEIELRTAPETSALIAR